MTKRSLEREKFLADVLLTTDGGINYWADVLTFKYDEEVPSNSVMTLEEYEDDDHVTHLVTIDTIAHGIYVLTTGENASKYFSICGPGYWKQFLLANRTNGAEGDYDADVADNILQAGLFNEVIYG